jgi:CDP-paratose 2-epimerase
VINRVLVTGGAGFIGSNLAEYFISKGCHVTVFDNLSRPGGGARRNIEYLTGKYKNNPEFEFVQGDVKDIGQLKNAVRNVDAVFHLAAQTAMTTSIDDPRDDFNTNGLGSVNVLEAVRNSDSQPVLVYTSTNKVYGDLTRKQVELEEKEKRWDFREREYQDGIDESYPLDYEGPYGCSKGVGDAYFLDYARTFKLKTVVFRMSGIYGTSQHPTEDQAWVAWFIRQAIQKKPVTIFGDGKQVRDILFITDLLNAFDRAVQNIDRTRGRVYNIGGGRENSISVLELLELIEQVLMIKPEEIGFGPWRLADQKVYISNTQKARREFGWEPKVSKEEGIKKLHDWMKSIY